MKVILTQWYLVFLMQLKWANSEILHTMEQEFIADYLDANPDLQPTFVMRTDITGFAEFGLTLNFTQYSCIYYEEREIEAVVERLASMPVEEKDFYGDNTVFFLGAGHSSIIQVVFRYDKLQRKSYCITFCRI